MTIRRFTVLAILLAVCVTSYMVWRGNEDHREFPEKLEEAIRLCRMRTYHDPNYDYEVRYPSFFEQLPDSLIDEPGCSQFRYWDNWVQIELTTRVVPNEDSLSTQEGMKRFAQLHHAKEQVMHDDSFMLSGPLYVNGSEIPNYRYHSKYVRHRRFWFVQMLVYPINCERAVRRLIQQVDDWRVWRSMC